MDLIIPTLWLCDRFATTLAAYLQMDAIGQVVVVDNNPLDRPATMNSLVGHQRLLLLEQTENIYVNAAWNLGIRSLQQPTGLVGVLNDDIALPEQVFQAIKDRSWKTWDVLGLLRQQPSRTSELTIKPLPYTSQLSIGHQYPGFGSALFFERTIYTPVPDRLRIWFGDDWILRHSTAVYGLFSPAITVEQHVSMKAMKKNSNFRAILESDKQAAQQLLSLAM